MVCINPKNHPSVGPFSCGRCGKDCILKTHKVWKDKYWRRKTMFRKWWKCESCKEVFMIESEKCFPADLEKELLKEEESLRLF